LLPKPSPLQKQRWTEGWLLARAAQEGEGAAQDGTSEAQGEEADQPWLSADADAVTGAEWKVQQKAQMHRAAAHCLRRKHRQ